MGNLVWHIVSIALFISYAYFCQHEWRVTVVLTLGVVHSFLHPLLGVKFSVSIVTVNGVTTTRFVD